MNIPHTRPGDDAAPDSSRLSSRIRRDSSDGCELAILGLPDDLGVRLNRGRAGAARGPSAFRAALARYGVVDPSGWEWPAIFDAGDVIPAPSDGPSSADDDRCVAALAETHRRVSDAVGALVDRGLVPIGVGGGHDLTFAFVRGIVERHRSPPRAGVSFDAHLDVRPTVGSGMGFRKLIEECGIRRLVAHGISPLVNSREHTAWFESHGGAAPRSARPADESSWPAGPFFVSFDLDVIDASAAPGVSAMNPSGWDSSRASEWAYAAGRHPRTRSFDLMELNPAHDPDGRTARLAAHLFACFARGWAERDRGTPIADPAP